MRIGRTLWRVILGIVGIFVVLVVALILLLQSGAVSRRVKDEVVPRISAALGREVTVGDAKLRIIPGPRVDLTQLAIAGRQGEPPLVELAAFEVSLRFWPLLTSLGHDIQVASIRLDRPVINLVRAPDGTWNYEGLGGERSTAPQPAPAPAQESQRTVVVSEASISNGSVRYVDRAAPRGEAAVAVSRIDFTADHVGIGQPLHAKLDAAIAGDEQNFHAEFRADRLPASAAALGPGTWPKLDGQLKLSGFELARVRAFLPASVTGMMTGGRADADAKLSTSDDGYHVDGSGKLGQVRLRGEPAQGGFDLHARFDPNTSALHATIDKLSLKGPGVDLGGNASVSRAGKEKRPVTHVRFAIEGPLLDLGQVLAVLPPSAPKPKQEGPLVTAEQREMLQTLDVSGTVAIAKVMRGALVANDFKAGARLERGAFVLNDAHATFFGGHVDASGTKVDLAPEVPKWNLATKLENVDLGQALNALSGSAPVLGKLNGGVALDGAGVDWPTLRKQITGQGAVALLQGALTTADLGGNVLGKISEGLRAVGKNAAAGTVAGAEGKTQLKDLAAKFTVKDGAMTLSQPMTFGAPFGTAQLGGKIGLDGELALSGTANVPKDIVAKIVAPAGIPAASALQVPLALSGPLTSPHVEVQAQQAVTNLIAGVAKQQVQQLQNRAVDEAKKAAGNQLGDILKGFGK